MTRTLFVGELNPYGADPEFALYPLPERSSGGRLCSLVLGMQRGEYLDRFDRANLCTGKWSIRAARSAATDLLTNSVPGRQALVLLGSKVCAAFGERFVPFRVGVVHCADRQQTEVPLVVLPHPSGLNRLWNEPGSFELARATLRRAGAL